MKKSVLIIALTVFSGSLMFSQEVCETKEETLDDLNSITKCTVNKTEKTSKKTGKKTKKLSVKISSSTRYLKRRIKEQKEQVSGLKAINTSGINMSSNNSSLPITKTLSLKDQGASNIKKLTSKITKDQLKNAFAFEDVDQIALFKDCKVSTPEDNSNCFNEGMMSHIQKHFKYPKEALINKIQGNVWVRFVIDEDGNITNLKTLAPKNGEVLKNEAIRVIANLTPFKPAIKKGKKVIVKYGFPINFSLED